MNSYFRQYCGCEAVRPWQCNVPRNSISAFRACSRSRGTYHEQVEHVLPTHKKTGSPNFNATSYDASDAFFLRPYLTREEYAYWNSHLSHFSPPCACSCACASNPKDNTIVTYQYTEPPVCVQNATGSPYLRSLLGCSVVRGKSASGNFARNSRFGPKPFAPEKVASTKNWGIKEASDPFYRHLAKTSCNKKSTMISKDKGSFDTTLKKKSIPLPDQVRRGSSPKNLPNNGGSTKKNHHELSAESRRKLSMKYLCGDGSLEENPSARVSLARLDKVKTASTVLSDFTGTLSARPGLGSDESLPLKRKSTSDPEHDCLPEGKSKRQCVDEDKHGNNDVEAPNETIDLNDTLQSFLSGPLAKRNSGHEQSESANGDESCEASTSPEVNKSGGMEMARDQHQNTHAEKDISTDDSKDGCEINGVNKVNSEPETKTPNITQTKTVPSDDLADVTVKSKCGNQTPADGDRPFERKVVYGDVISKEKPVQRNLLKNTQSSLLCGSYALDYKSLPKLISVLSTPMAKAVSSLTI